MSCSCRTCKWCRRRPTLVAPRLHRAATQKADHDRRRVQAMREIAALEGLVAHRELQLARAYTTRNPTYMNLRGRKLRHAQTRLQRAQATLEALNTA